MTVTEDAAGKMTQEKAELRARMAALRKAIPPETRKYAAESLVILAELPEFRVFLPEKEGVIGGFIPIRSEINPLPLMRRLASEGFRLALPRISGAGLVFHAYTMGDDLVEGPLKTREPHITAPLAKPDLILAALLAFDRDCIRIGYGKAYYDRAFAEHPRAKRIGLAFSAQEVAHVPREAHDAPLDAILTESGMIKRQ